MDRFTGLDQSNYVSRSFIFTTKGLTTLDKTRRQEEALYRGGQVYVPKGINLADVNPRPVCQDQPTNGLIGCFSGDEKLIFATAWEPYQELFQGVGRCLHADFRLGGLEPGETKTIRGKIYIVPNDVPALLKRYAKDLPEHAGAASKR